MSDDAMSVRVYLAGASREHARIARWAMMLERSPDICISLRWFDGAEAWAGRDSRLPRAEQQQHADSCELAIRSSRIFWLLWPAELTYGAFVELGYALSHRFHVARQFDVVVSGQGSAQSVFTASADYRDDSDALAFGALVALAQRHRAAAQEPRR